MFVLGIDPGLTRTGYGLVCRGKPHYAMAAGVLRTPAGTATPTRLAELYDDLVELMRSPRPDIVVVEKVFTNRNRQTAIDVGRASGVVLLVAAQAGVEVVEYTPTAIKLAVTGDGSAGKVQVQDMVARRLNLSEHPKPADAADALAVALCHLQSVRLRGAG